MDEAAGLGRSVRNGVIAARLDEAQLSRRGKPANASPPRPTLRQRLRRELRRAARLLLRPFARRDGPNGHDRPGRVATGTTAHRRDVA